jgi:predicted ATP-grasp superfamily ATP-dependent carboligase
VDPFFDWLLEFGKKSPGAVLYPTSDDLAWLFALRRQELESTFRLYQPSADVIYTLLNKKRLFKACHEVGLESPETVFPETERDVEREARNVTFPVLLKPQTQILFERHIKGERVADPEALLSRYHEFVRSNPYGRHLLDYDPAVQSPMIQRFHSEASENIYSISGFVDEQGRHALRAAVKVLQKPRKLGVGLCFEAAPVHPALSKASLALCKHVGYYGVFEVEFIQADGKFLVIDFNPRFYGQMGFEIARQLPLPQLVYDAALGDTQRLQSTLERANAPDREARIYCHRMVFELLLGLQGLSRKLSSEERRRWHEWYARHRDVAADAVLDSADPIPTLVDAVNQLNSYARHPRHFFLSIVLDR